MPRIGFRSIVLLVLLMGALAPVAAAGGGGVPVPSCGWAPAGLISQSVGDRVKPLKPVWTTQLAPVLSCSYTERSPHLQLGNAAVVVIEFRELQWVRPPHGAKAVPHLGSCVSAKACPAPGQPAWLIEQGGAAAGGPGKRYSVRFVSAAALEVQDGLDALIVVINTPQGPLPIANEPAALERIAKAVLPRFYSALAPA